MRLWMSLRPTGLMVQYHGGAFIGGLGIVVLGTLEDVVRTRGGKDKGELANPAPAARPTNVPAQTNASKAVCSV